MIVSKQTQRTFHDTLSSSLRPVIEKMNSSVVMNVLYGYFDVKKNKLKWTGSLEDLKAFVLTLIDEETAEATTAFAKRWKMDL